MIYTKNPLHLALEKLISKHRANINNPDETGFTPLMLAAQQGRLDLVKSLIDAGAELDTVAFSKSSISSATLGLGPIEYAEFTALMIAADKGYTDIESLLNDGVNASLVNEKRETALDIELLQLIELELSLRNVVPDEIVAPVELLKEMELLEKMGLLEARQLKEPVELLKGMGLTEEEMGPIGSIEDSWLTSGE